MDTKKKEEISRSKQQILLLSKELTSLLSKINTTTLITKGSIYDQKKKCGNKKCKCVKGELHSTKLLSYSNEGKTRLIPLTKYNIFEIAKIKRQVKNYQQFRRNRGKVVHNFKLLIEEINKMEKNLLKGISPKKGEKNERQRRDN